MNRVTEQTMQDLSARLGGCAALHAKGTRPSKRIGPEEKQDQHTKYPGAIKHQTHLSRLSSVIVRTVPV